MGGWSHLQLFPCHDFLSVCMRRGSECGDIAQAMPFLRKLWSSTALSCFVNYAIRSTLKPPDVTWFSYLVLF